jgi:YHS domain-containing protein
MKRDPVCGMLIDPADALRLEYHGNTYYFCSLRCRREFEDRPDEYAKHPSSMVIDGLIFEPTQIRRIALQEE